MRDLSPLVLDQCSPCTREEDTKSLSRQKALVDPDCPVPNTIVISSGLPFGHFINTAPWIWALNRLKPTSIPSITIMMSMVSTSRTQPYRRTGQTMKSGEQNRSAYHFFYHLTNLICPHGQPKRPNQSVEPMIDQLLGLVNRQIDGFEMEYRSFYRFAPGRI